MKIQYQCKNANNKNSLCYVYIATQYIILEKQKQKSLTVSKLIFE